MRRDETRAVRTAGEDDDARAGAPVAEHFAETLLLVCAQHRRGLQIDAAQRAARVLVLVQCSHEYIYYCSTRARPRARTSRRSYSILASLFYAYSCETVSAHVFLVPCVCILAIIAEVVLSQ